MRVLSELRGTLEDGARKALAPITALEQRGRTLAAQLAQLGARLGSESSALSQRVERARGQLEAELTQARSSATRTSPGRASGGLAPLESEASALTRTSAEASAALRSLTASLSSQTGNASAALSTALSALASSRQTIERLAASGLALIKDVEMKLEALRKTTLAQIASLEAAFDAAIETIQSAANTFIDGLRAIIRQFRSLVAAATGPVMIGANALQELVTDLVTTANTLIEQVQNVVGLAVGAIDMIPVAALPMPLAGPTIDTLTQLATQFATQLENGAKAASSQLTTLATTVSSAIDTGRSTLSEQLDAALSPLLAQADQLTQQIDQKRAEIETQVSAQIAAVGAQVEQAIDAARSQVDALTQPVLTQVASYTEQLASAATAAAASATAALDSASQQASTLSASWGRGIAESQAAFAALEAQQTELTRKLRALRA